VGGVQWQARRGGRVGSLRGWVGGSGAPLPSAWPGLLCCLVPAFARGAPASLPALCRGLREGQHRAGPVLGSGGEEEQEPALPGRSGAPPPWGAAPAWPQRICPATGLPSRRQGLFARRLRAPRCIPVQHGGPLGHQRPVRGWFLLSRSA